MDVFTPEKRSEIMRRVRSKDTHPEKIVRSLAHRLGFRFRLHRSDLPGKPDLVFPRLHKVIFVNGCFWHGHDCRSGTNKPKSNISYWTEKLSKNMKRDSDNICALQTMGWKVLIIWECETKNLEEITASIKSFLNCSSP